MANPQRLRNILRHLRNMSAHNRDISVNGSTRLEELCKHSSVSVERLEKIIHEEPYTLMQLYEPFANIPESASSFVAKIIHKLKCNKILFLPGENVLPILFRV